MQTKLMNPLSSPSNSRRPYQPKALPDSVFRDLAALCDIIIPADQRSGSAEDAEVASFLDYVASESKPHHRRIIGGILWLNSRCNARHGAPFALCSHAQRLEVVRSIAYRRNGFLDPQLLPGIELFAYLRREVLSAFFTSKIGIADLDYRGNQVVPQFLGCPVTVPLDDADSLREPDAVLEPEARNPSGNEGDLCS